MRRFGVRALVLGLIADLALVFVAGSQTGLTWRAGPLRISLHDPANPLIIMAVLSGLMVAAAWSERRSRGWALATAVIVAAAAAIAVVRGAARLFPLADIAVLELYVRDALTGKLLVGPYSHFGWHHPGPAYFYLAAPAYAFGGEQPAALAAGVVAIVFGAVALIAWMASRSVGAALSMPLLALAVLYLVRWPELAISPWNPHVVIVPTMAVIVGGAGVASGDVAMLPVAAFLASLAMQTHVGVAPVAIAIVAVSAIAGTAAARRHKQLQRARRAVVRTLWVLLPLWFLPAAEQMAHAPGNLTLLWRFFVSSSGTGQPLDVAARAWAEMLSAPFTSMVALAGGSPFEPTASQGPLVFAALQLVALAAAAAWSWRVRNQGVAWLALLALLASLIGLWSVTRIEGRLMDHAIFWLTGIGVVNLATIAAAAALYVRARIRADGTLFRTATRAAPLVHGALVTLCLLVIVSGLGEVREGRLPVTLSSPVAAQLGGGLRDYVTANGVNRPLVRIGEDVWGTAAGALLELSRAGVPFAVERSWLPMFPQSFAPTGDEDAEITVSSQLGHVKLVERPGNVAVVSSGAVYFDAVRRPRSP